MKDDVSAIPTTGCTVVTGNTSLSNYIGRTRKDYIFIGGTWYLYRTSTSNYSDYDISGFNCIQPSDLNSYAVYTPIIYGVAFFLFICSVWLFFTTIKGFMYGIK